MAFKIVDQRALIVGGRFSGCGRACPCWRIDWGYYRENLGHGLALWLGETWAIRDDRRLSMIRRILAPRVLRIITDPSLKRG